MAVVVVAFWWMAFAQSPVDNERQRTELQLQKIEKQLEEKTGSVQELTEKEEQAQAQSRVLRGDIELLTEVRARLQKKFRHLGTECSAIERWVGELEEQHLFRQEVLSRTLASLYTSKVVSGFSGLLGGGSAAKRRQFFARLVSEAQAERIQSVIDSLAAGESRRADLEKSRQRVKTAEASKEKEKAKKERLVAKAEREAFGYRQRREQELDEIEQIQREALILTELVDRLAALPGVHGAIDYDFPGWKGRLHWPLKGPVKSTVGRKIDPKYRTETFESGIFISGSVGDVVVNAADGEVAYAGRRRGLGNVVVLGHGAGYYSIFAHLGQISVIVGQVLRSGDQVGTAGESHPRYGAGILFELRHEKKILDPLEWLK